MFFAIREFGTSDSWYYFERVIFLFGNVSTKKNNKTSVDDSEAIVWFAVANLGVYIIEPIFFD